MNCPKCGGAIPFYDLKPACRHCGVNIMFYTQNDELMRDAKRTELEGAAARMIIARVKAAFIGSKIAVVRMIFSLGALAALLVPFGGVNYELPFFSETFSVGIIGIIQAVSNGLLLNILNFTKSSLLGGVTLAAAVNLIFMAVIALIAAAVLAVYIIGFINLTKSAKAMKNISLAGVFAGVAAQTASIIIKFTADKSEIASVYFGFGGLAAAAVFFALFAVNRAMLKNGIEPEYRENDIKRREVLKKVRAGEISLDDLPLPVFESEEEREERMKALGEALLAEEEGKEL